MINDSRSTLMNRTKGIYNFARMTSLVIGSSGTFHHGCPHALNFHLMKHQTYHPKHFTKYPHVLPRTFQHCCTLLLHFLMVKS